MASETKLLDRARDELFSHINRCGVLKAEEEDQRRWMDETIDYIGERYPDLTNAHLQDLYMVGIRFCKPAIPHGAARDGGTSAATPESEGATSVSDEVDAAPAEAEAPDSVDSVSEATVEETEPEDAAVA